MGWVPDIAQTIDLDNGSSGVFCQALSAKKRMDAGGVFGRSGVE
jgi:hypothetical protein